jgi:hypothetical protein
MRINKEDMALMLSKIKELWTTGNQCQICEHRDWSVSDRVFELREFHGGDLKIGGSSVFPTVPVTCNNCGNVVFLNALILGLAKPKMTADVEVHPNE